MTHPLGYICYRAATPIPIDGDLTKPVWDAAPWTSYFVDIEGDLKPAPRFRTRVKMLWDDEYFYIAAEMEEPHVWATLTEHDSVIFQDNDFEVFIDPDGDNHNYFEIEVNALNTTWDLRLPKPYRDGGPALNEWESKVVSAVKVFGSLNDASDTDTGWTLEMAFPWQAFAEHAGCPCPPRVNDCWRVNFSRVEWEIDVVEEGFPYRKVDGRPEDNWVWTRQHTIDMHRPEMWGYVQFSALKHGQSQFAGDPDWATRASLMQIYYSQKAHYAESGRYLQDQEALLGHSGAVVQLTHDGFRATLDGLEIRQDSRITRT